MAKTTQYIKQILVYADWLELGGTKRVGTLQSEQIRGKEVFSFTYHKEWLESGMAIMLDPDLGLFTGPQYNQEGKPNFGLFLDSSPEGSSYCSQCRTQAADIYRQ